MLRQLANLRQRGRLRTNRMTPRTNKPAILREHPALEITNFLELIVADHHQPDKEFFFVEIGAFDGKTADPIYNFVHRHGWHGVLVEPQWEAFERLKANYKNQSGLTFCNVAIGDQDGDVTLYTRNEGMLQAASLDKQLVSKPGRKRRRVDARRVPCWTLQTLLEKTGAPHDFDLLQIDAEGHDFEIIKSIDFQSICPAIIRYEHMVLSESDRNECLEFLASYGYRFLLEDGDTTAYRKATKARQIAVA